ncbi:MAG: UDPglucose 6-dehydrogenase [Parcubacteria group bacterium Athens1014_10]|nr:MAG: UDPglucose 6-dehydrogenase [Parcubacteria group bacterium Athens1014_10]TSD05462.1 MAG: UDPglucose 6-dehydrogenase [Parcubacteria group bacterium Athens0714_12]
MKVYIIGVGYVGLVAAAYLAELGHKVCGVDINPQKIEMLKNGESPIYEPGLKKLLKKNIAKKKLIFRVNIDEEVNKYDLAIIAVGTPEREKDGQADLFYVGETAKQIAQHVNLKEFIVVGKSTVPIGTAQQIRESLAHYNKSGTIFHVGSNPETLREGCAVQDFMNPDRIIIGGDEKVRKILLRLYSKIKCLKILTDTESAELTKLASNFILAERISTANILSRICDMTGADIERVMEGVGLDARIGRHFLKAGVGYGGSCFPKDTKSIRSIAEHYRLDTNLFDAVIEINESQKNWFMKKVKQMAILTLRKRLIAVWGLAFKPNTDDTREAPSVKIIRELLEEKAQVRVYDPVANLKKEFENNIVHCSDMYEAVKGAEILLIVTEWDCFKEADLKKVKSLMTTPKIVDGRNIYNPSDVRALGFIYASMGRP